MSLRIAIATPTPHDRQETFVRAHVELLDKVVLVLTDGSLPSCDAQGHPLLGDTLMARVAMRVRGLLGIYDRKQLLRARIAERLREARVDVVLAEYGNTADAMRASCAMAGVPLVAYFLGFDAYSAETRERTGHYKALFAEASGFVAVSVAMQADLQALGAPPDRMRYNICGVDVERFTAGDPASAPPVFVSVGRFVDKKAPLLMLASFRRVLLERPQARLVMVGDGPLWEACHHLVKAEGMDGNVELRGTQEHAALATLMHSARAFVQHSVRSLGGDREGTPVAVLEAMSCGLPVIATRHMGIADVVDDGVTGLLSAEHDIGGMAANLIAMVDDPARAARMGAAGRVRVREHYDMKGSIARLQSFLEECAKRPVTKR